MALDVPPLPAGQPIVDPKTGLPTMAFTVYWQQSIGQIEGAINAVAAAQAAADAANAAAATANTAATTANAAATASTAATALQNSWVTGCTITSTDAGTDVTITISAHTRNYANGTSVAVDGGSLTGRAYSTKYYIYYDQASRAGGTVTYASTTTESTAAQTGDRHTVGHTTTPAAAGAPTGGVPPRAPGIEP